MRVYVVRKWSLRGRCRFVCWNIALSKSVVTVQRAFRAKYAKDPPTDKTIRAWYKQFTETGCLCKQKAPMLTRVWQERVPCHPWCTHRISLVVKKNFFQFSCGCEQFH